MLLAFGGGSVIDCCKIVSAQAKLAQDIWEMGLAATFAEMGLGEDTDYKKL